MDGAGCEALADKDWGRGLFSTAGRVLAWKPDALERPFKPRSRRTEQGCVCWYHVYEQRTTELPLCARAEYLLGPTKDAMTDTDWTRLSADFSANIRGSIDR